jgi:hypothetical protein
VAIVARTGPLSLQELTERVVPLLDPGDLERFPSLSLEKRLELMGPVIRRNDGRFDLPSGGVHGVNDKRVRRLNAMIGVIERRGPSHFTLIAQELDDHLPSDYRLSERDVHAWLGRYEDIFVWVGPGRFGLKSHNVGTRVDRSKAQEGVVAGYRSRRRRGIGDEIAVLLRERGPLSLDTVVDHILSRFQVHRTSVVAAVHQDAAQRFALSEDRVVMLRALEDRSVS